MRAWRKLNEAAHRTHPTFLMAVAGVYLVTAVGGLVFLSTMRGSGRTSVPMWVYWLLDVLWFGLAGVSFFRARRDLSRQDTIGP
jgi:uncharacterized RDD family membrane protein YckC